MQQSISEQALMLKPYEKLALIEELLRSLDETWFNEAENRLKVYRQERLHQTSNHNLETNGRASLLNT
jgi:hypothetical protein